MCVCVYVCIFGFYMYIYMYIALVLMRKGYRRPDNPFRRNFRWNIYLSTIYISLYAYICICIYVYMFVRSFGSYMFVCMYIALAPTRQGYRRRGSRF